MKTPKEQVEENGSLPFVNASIPKRADHDHFWIEDGVLYESYSTIRGMRYLKVMEVHGMPDEYYCSKDCLNYIAKEYCD